jgi:STE24 endopeptidase
LFVESKVDNNDFVFLFSCLLSFPFTLITTFASRVCYCYTCNLLLETKLTELECLFVNFKRLFAIYLPFITISSVIPSVYLLGLSESVSIFLCLAILLGVLVLYVFFTPRFTAFNYKACEIGENTMLRHRLEKLMNKHGITRYKLYLWDSSRTKESNAMVSGIFTCYLFISSTLLEDVTLPELETVITHEIGHVKNHHLLKMLIGKLFVVGLLVGLVLVPFLFHFEILERTVFYFGAIFIVCFMVVIWVKLERKYEDQADLYATGYNDPELFASALRKISKYEEHEEYNKLDEIFMSHSSMEQRIEKSSKK